MSSSRFYTINTLCIHTLHLTTPHAIIEITSLHNYKKISTSTIRSLYKATLQRVKNKDIYTTPTQQKSSSCHFTWSCGNKGSLEKLKLKGKKVKGQESVYKTERNKLLKGKNKYYKTA